MSSTPIHNPSRPATVSMLRIAAPFLVLCYALVFAVAFRFVLTDHWAYSGFIWRPSESVWQWAFILIVLLLPSFSMSVTYNRPSRLVLWLLYIVVYIPACLVWLLQDGVDGTYGVFLFALLLCFQLLILITELPIMRIQLIRLPLSAYLGAILSGTLVVTVASVIFYGLPASIPGFSDVYTVRTQMGDQSGSVPGIIVYLISWQYKVVNPLLIAIGIQYRRLLPVAAGLLGQLYFYGISGHKSIVFSVVLVVGIWLIGRWFSRGIGPIALIATAGAIVATSVITFLGQLMPFSIMMRRLLVVPGLLTGWYVEFFTEFGFTRHMDPLTRMLFDYPYEMTPPFLIGLLYTGSEDTAANVNFWASTYSAFGVLGMIIATLILGLLLWGMNSLARNHGFLIGNVLVVLSAFSLMNSDLFVTIGTHGLGLAFLLLMISPRSEVEDDVQPAQLEEPQPVGTASQ